MPEVRCLPDLSGLALVRRRARSPNVVAILGDVLVAAVIAILRQNLAPGVGDRPHPRKITRA